MSREKTAFTKAQQRIIDSEVYPFCLASVAGSGKTEIITERIMRLIKKGVTLTEIAVITFTNKATGEMRDRLAEKLYASWTAGGRKDGFIRNQLDSVQAADISTIHSFCQRLLSEHGMELGIAPSFAVSGFRYETDKIIEAAIRTHYDRQLLRDIPIYKIKDIVKELYYHNTDKGIEFTPDSAVIEQDEWEQLTRLIIEVYTTAAAEIEAEKKRQNKLTQNDLIRKTAELLAVDSVARIVAKRYKYIYIDEMQDTNQDQARLAEALQAHGVKVFVAGDDRQSIYAFRGADVRSFRRLAEQSSKETLTENFRARPSIVKFINDLFGSRFYRGSRLLQFQHTPMTATRNEPDKNPSVEMRYGMEITEIIKKWQTDVRGLDTVWYNNNIGILCRNNRDLTKYAGILKRAGIPVKVIGGKGFYSQDSIVDTYKILNALVNKGIAEETEALFTDYYCAFCSDYSGQDKEPRFMELLAELREELRSSTITRFLRILYDTTNIIEFYKKGGQEQQAANLYKLTDIARRESENGMQPVDFLRWLDIKMSSGQEEDSAELGRDKASDAVVVTTIHRAKGLAYDIVIIPRIEANLNRQARPKILFSQEKRIIAINPEAVTDPQKEQEPNESYESLYREWAAECMEEELRVLFVAMTRAKNYLILGTESPKTTIEYRQSKDASYISYYRWLYERDRGKLLSEIEQ